MVILSFISIPVILVAFTTTIVSIIITTIYVAMTVMIFVLYAIKHDIDTHASISIRSDNVYHKKDKINALKKPFGW